MIAIFTLVGLMLFGGGLYAVYDGWPYLVLERGFTEVIIGSIATTAGLIMLSLAWVLKQLKALRTELAEARIAAPAADDAALPTAPAFVDPALPAGPRDPMARAESAVPSPVVPVAIGVGAVGLGAAAVAAAVAEKEEPPAAEPEALERDLFGALVAEHLIADPEEGQDEQDAPVEPLCDEAVPDMFEKDVAEIEPAEAARPIAVEAESHEPAEIVAAHVQPVSQDEALAHSDEPSERDAEEPADIGEEVPADETATFAEPPPAEEAGPRDEFAILRESLTNQLGGLSRPAGRIEPSFGRNDPFADAEAWMKPAAERQEPRFDVEAPVADEAKPAAPLWPPRTGAQTLEPPIVSKAEEADEAPPREGDEPDQALDEPASSSDAVEDEAPEEEAASDATPEPSAPEPAASEEGVVGAYQVGEAHFTIFADGSIRARTPDGEYSFASMDELKVYLASEKSRLGV